jgi:hypothetical protein
MLIYSYLGGNVFCTPSPISLPYINLDGASQRVLHGGHLYDLIPSAKIGAVW